MFLVTLTLLPSSGKSSSGKRPPGAHDPRRLRLIDVFELEWVSDPRISPDGEHIVYVRNFFDLMSDRRRSILWVVAADGSDHRPLTTGLANDASLVSLSLAGNVTTPTMLLTGEADHRTPISESEQYYQALKLRRVDTVLVRFPGASHGIARRPSHLMSKVAHVLGWFERHRGRRSKWTFRGGSCRSDRRRAFGWPAAKAAKASGRFPPDHEIDHRSILRTTQREPIFATTAVWISPREVLTR